MRRSTKPSPNADGVADRVQERGATGWKAVGVRNDTEAHERIDPGSSMASGVTRIVDGNAHLGRVCEVVDRPAGSREVEVQQRVRDILAMHDVLGQTSLWQISVLPSGSASFGDPLTSGGNTKLSAASW